MRQREDRLPAGADRLISDAKGIDAVVVNGADAVDPRGPLPGKLLRNGKG